MKKQMMYAGLVVLVSALPGICATLTVQQDTATADGSLYDYSYQFAVSGSGAFVDNIFLGSNDLSPLNLVLMVDGSPTTDWSWLGNDIPVNYLQFFDTAATGLGSGDVLDVTFSSALAPASTQFAVGLDSVTSGVTNEVNAVLGPTAVMTTPEPGTILLFACGLMLIVGRRYQNWIRL